MSQFFPALLAPRTTTLRGRLSRRDTMTMKSTSAFLASPTRPALPTARRNCAKKLGEASNWRASVSAPRARCRTFLIRFILRDFFFIIV